MVSKEQKTRVVIDVLIPADSDKYQGLKKTTGADVLVQSVSSGNRCIRSCDQKAGRFQAQHWRSLSGSGSS